MRTMKLSSTSSTGSAGSWVRHIYLYAVSLVSLVVFIIGSVTLVNTVMRRYVFGLETSYYRSPAQECTYIKDPDYYGGRVPTPVMEEGNAATELSEEEKQQQYDECVSRIEMEISQQSKHDLADSISWSFAMMLVSIPLYLFHSRLLHREKKTKK